jgi:hypothetical protein
MHTPGEAPVSRGLSAALDAVRRVRRRVEAYARRYRHADAGQIVAKLIAELGEAEPILAASLHRGMLAAWVAAARAPARDLPRYDLPPGSPPDGPGARQGAFGEPDGTIRFPAIEAGVRDLLARRVVTPEEYVGLAEDAQGAAFTVARVVSADAVARVQRAVADDLARGGDLRTFRRAVGAELGAAGLGDAQVEALYRTQTGLARAAGMQQVLDHPLVADEFPYVRYSATHDARVRPEHALLERCGIQGTEHLQDGRSGNTALLSAVGVELPLRDEPHEHRGRGGAGHL